jgi:cellobiose-specific phosphotransferase system component IIA
MAVDTDTKKYLEEVKKGKPRRFVMICKGVKILSMIVFKKGTVEKYKKQAKEEGKGQFYHGVVDGKGMSISFKLCRSDGYEKPPGKELILKDFLKTEADMKFKPTYELVDELPEVSEDDEEEQLKDSPTDGGKATPEPTAGAPPAPEVDPAEAFKTRLTELLPQIKQAAGTTAGDEAKLKASEAGVFARKHDFERAGALLDEAEAILKQPPPPPPEVPPAPEIDPAEAFKTHLTELLPLIKQAAGTIAGDEAKLKASEAGVFARKQDFEQANALLDEAEALLKQPPPPPPTETSPPPEAPPAPEVDPAEAFKTRLTELLPQIKQAAGTTAGDEAKLKASEAGVFARKHDFERAGALLKEAETLLKQPPPPPTKTAPPQEAQPAPKESSPDTQPPESPTTDKTEGVEEDDDEPPLEEEELLDSLIPDDEDDLEDVPPPPPLPPQDPNRLLTDEELEELKTPVETVSTVSVNGRLAWEEAKDTVAEQVAALQVAMRNSGDTDLERISEYGLSGITGKLRVGLRVALMEFDRAGSEGREKARKKALDIVDEYKKFVDTNPLIALCDENPFAVKVEIRKTLGEALARLREALSA